MARDFQIDLSTGELYVLAGLLQYSSLMGIESATMQRWSGDMISQVRNTVEQLERKKLIIYELTGKLFIESHLHEAMDCFGAPDKVCVISENRKSGEGSATYVFERNGKYAMVSKKDVNTYSVVLYSDFDIWSAISAFFRGYEEISFCERLSLKDIEMIKKKAEVFQKEDVFACIRKCVSNEDAVREIFSVLSGDGGFVDIQILVKRKSFYETVLQTLVFVAEEHAIKIELKEDNLLQFSCLKQQELQKDIEEKFTTHIQKDAEAWIAL